MGEITITVEEYRDLIEAKVRLKAFSEFVGASDYRIEREDCARFLGFKLPDLGEDQEES